MKTVILLGLFLHCGDCLQLDHEGHPFRKSEYQRHEVPNHQPPYLVVEKTNIHKRRLDVWKPVEDHPTPNTSNQPTPTLKTLTSPRYQHHDPAPPQRASYAPTPPPHQPLPHIKLASKLGTKVRPKYQHYPEPPQPQRSAPRLAPAPLSSYTPPKLTAKLPKKPLNLPGYPVRRIEERKDVIGYQLKNPLLHSPSNNGFLSPLPSSFTYSRPPLPVKNPLLIPKLKVEVVEEDSPAKPLDGEEQFEDLLFHLDNYYKNDDYIPANKSKQQPVENTIEYEKEPETFDLTPVFPRLQRQDVINALEVMDETLKPLVAVADRVSSSFSLDSTRKQTVEELLDPARQDSDQLLDGVAEAVQFTVQQVLEKPKPLIILTALLLSVITGSAIGNTLTTLNAATRDMDFQRRIGDCPVGYEVVYIGTEGEVVTVGEIFNVRVKREELEGGEKEEEEDPDRKGYAYGTSPLSKKAASQEKMENSGEYTGKAGYFCKKVFLGTKDGDGGQGAVGIRVNSDSSDDNGGTSGQVSITVGGVSVTVGGEGGVLSAARAGDGETVRYMEEDRQEEQEDETYKDGELAEVAAEQEEEEEEDNETGGVFDGIKIVLIDSLRQIRSLLTG